MNLIQVDPLMFAIRKHWRRIVSFVLAMLLFAGNLPMPALSISKNQPENTALGEDFENMDVENKIAVFDMFANFMVAKDPTAENIEDVAFWVDVEDVGAKGLVVKILDAYYDATNGYYWYQIGPHNTSALPEALQGCTWVRHWSEWEIEMKMPPALALYNADQAIQFVDATYTVGGETMSTYFVVAGPAALKRAIITIAQDHAEYETSALSHYAEWEQEDGALVRDSWHLAFQVQIYKSDGLWTAEDGQISIRYPAASFGACDLANNSLYGGVFAYEGQQISDFSAVEWEVSGSGLVYANGGSPRLVYELMDESFRSMDYRGYFATSAIELYDAYLSEDTKALTWEESFQYVDVDAFFLDANGYGWYWVSDPNLNGGKYFLVSAGLLEFSYEEGPLDVDTAYLFLMNCSGLESFEYIYGALTENVISQLQQEGLWTEIQTWYNHLVYCAFYAVNSVAEYEELRKAYPDAWAYIQENPDYKACMDLLLENLRYMEAHPQKPDVELGEFILADSDKEFNAGGIVNPAGSAEAAQSQVVVPRSAQGYTNFARNAHQQRLTATDMRASQEKAGKDDSIEMSKVVTPVEGKENAYNITLEIFTTGTTVVVQHEKEVPTDIIMVLDLSSSMGKRFQAEGYKQVVHGTAQDMFVNHQNDLYIKSGESYNKVSIKGVGNATQGGNKKDFSQSADEVYKAIQRGTTVYVDINGVPRVLKANVSNQVNSGGSYYVLYTFQYATPDGDITIMADVNQRSSISNTYNTYTMDAETYPQYEFSYTEAGESKTIVYDAGQSVTGLLGDTGASNPIYYVKAYKDTTKASRFDALLNAVENFVYAVEQKAKGADGDLATTEDNVNHRIAIIGFTGNTDRNCEGVYIGDQLDKYQDGISDETYRNALQDMADPADVENVYKSVGMLSTGQGTYAHYGMNMAIGVLSNMPQTNEQRNKVVIFFTDGEPNDFNRPIDGAYTIKNTYGATVYAVGILDNGNATLPVTNRTAQVNRYMHRISSNYLDARNNNANSNYTQNPATVSPNTENYYLLAKNANELSGIFETIGNNLPVGKTEATLSTSSVIKDVVSDYFMLPEGATTEDIKVYTSDFTGMNGEERMWTEPVAFTDAVIEIERDGRTVNISGFDFQSYWVGMHPKSENSAETEPGGKKLIVEIPIEPAGSFLGGGDVPTNGSASGVYNGGSPVSKFEQPTADILIEDIAYKEGTMNIYYGNAISLTDLLDHLVKSLGNVPLENVANSVNNGFLDMQFTVTAEVDGVEHKYIFTLEAGQDWTEGTWQENGSITEALNNVILSENTTYTVHLVMEHTGRDMLDLSIKAAENLVQSNYTAASWKALQDQLVLARQHLGLSEMERAHANKDLLGVMEKMQLNSAVFTGDETATELQRMILIAEATMMLYTDDPSLPYQEYLVDRLATAKATLTSYQNATAEEKELAKALATDATSRLHQVLHNIIQFYAVEGSTTINVFTPKVTLKDSVRDYLQYLYYYTVDSFAVVRSAVTAAQNKVKDLSVGIHQAIADLKLKSSYGESYIDELRKAMLIAQSLDMTVSSDVSDALQVGASDIEVALGNLVLAGSSINQDDHSLRLWMHIAQQLNEEDYDAGSFATMEAALDAARAVLENPDADAKAYSNAQETLHDAIEALKLARSTGNTDMDKLQKLVLLTENLQRQDFTLLTYGDLEDELWEMRNSLRQQTDVIENDLEAVKSKTDYQNDVINELMLALQIADDLNAVAANYTADSWAILQEACAIDGNDLLAEDNSKLSVHIKNAINNLALTENAGNREQLKRLFLLAQSILPEGAKSQNATKEDLTAEELAAVPYRADLVEKLYDAYRSARTVLNSSSQNTTTVQRNLQNAINAIIAEGALKTKTGNGDIDDLLVYLLVADAMYAEEFPDQQAFLQSHLAKVEWFCGDVSSENVTMKGKAPAVELEWELQDVGDIKKEDLFKDHFMNSKIDVPVNAKIKVTGKLADGVENAETIILTKDSDLIEFAHVCDRLNDQCFYNPETEEFMIHVRNLTLVIEVQGDTGDHDVILFKIEGSDGSVLYVTVDVREDGKKYAIIFGGLKETAVINGKEQAVRYTITQITQWNWQTEMVDIKNHTGVATQVSKGENTIVLELHEDFQDNKVNHVIFETDSDSNWLADEDWVDNDMSKLPESTEGGGA